MFRKYRTENCIYKGLFICKKCDFTHIGCKCKFSAFKNCFEIFNINGRKYNKIYEISLLNNNKIEFRDFKLKFGLFKFLKRLRMKLMDRIYKKNFNKNYH